MPKARSSSYANKLTETPVIVVTSLRPRERPIASVRQRRIAEFCSADAGRKRRKERNTRKRTAVTDCTTAAAVTVAASCKVWDPCLLNFLMEPSKAAVQSDDVQVLFPARDILYSDSEVAILSAHSSWYVGITEKQCTPPNDPPPFRISTSSTVCMSVEDKIPPRPSCQVGLVDGTGVGDKNHTKPGEGSVSSDDMANNIDKKEVQKPYRQVWHSLWEHQVGKERVGSNKSTRASKPVDQMVFDKRPIEQVAASTNNVCSPPNTDRKQRRGVFHPTPITHMRMKYRSVNRPWGRPIHQRVPSSGTRGAQRKLSAMKDEHLVDDSEILFEGTPRMRRCEPARKRQGVPRVVVTTASRPMTAVSPERPDLSSSVHPRSAPANPKPGAPENVCNRLPRLSTTAKPINRPRFSVPIKASRVPMDLLFKEMNSPKPSKDLNSFRGLPLKHRGPHRGASFAETRFHDLNHDVFYRDAGQSMYFNLPERSCQATLRNNRRIFNWSNMNSNEYNPAMSYPVSFQTDAECMPTSNNLLANDISSPHPDSRTTLRPQHGDRTMEKESHRNVSSANFSVSSRLYGHDVTSRQSVLKSPLMYNFGMESDNPPHAGPRFPVAASGIPPIYHNAIPVPSYYLYDGHGAASNQTAPAYHFSYPNAPGVLISPPPNPLRRKGTLRVPGGKLESDTPPVAEFSNQGSPTVSFVPRYFGVHSREATIEEDCITPQPILQPNIAPRAFMPSVDFSRIGTPPRQHPEIFPFIRADGHEIFSFGHAGRPPYQTSLQQEGIQIPFPTSTQSENAYKPLKMLLTFGAQVPSSERVPLSSVVCGYLSSPRVETEVKVVCQQDQLKSSIFSNAPPEVLAEVPKKECGINLRSDTGEGSAVVAPTSQPTETVASVDTGYLAVYADKHRLSVETTGGIMERDKDGTAERQVKTLATGYLSLTHGKPNRLEPITKTSSLVECVSVENPKLPDFPFELAKAKSLGLCTCAYSVTKLSTVTERSSEAQQAAGSPLTEVSGLELDLAYPRDTLATSTPTEAEQERRFQLVKSKSVEGLQGGNAKDQETCVMRCNLVELVDDAPVFQTIACTVNSSGMLPGDVSITEVYDDDDSSMKNDTTLNERCQRFSDFRSSCTESTAYQVSSSCPFTKRKTSVTESMTTCLDAINDRRVTALKPADSSDARHRFQSLVSRFGARRHIALQCQLGEKTRTVCGSESVPSDSKISRTSRSLDNRHDAQEIRRKDVCIQVPVLCCQSVETEPYTVEKGVPECRAGLTLRLMSTVVDVPPVVKVTENIGISTEDKVNEEIFIKEERLLCSDRTQAGESKITSELVCSLGHSNADDACPISFHHSADCGRHLVNVPVSTKQLKRLKPFFRSHCCELANICALAAMHSISVHTKSVRCSCLSKEEKLCSDFAPRIVGRKKEHPGYCDENGNEQPESVPKQLMYDRRVAFRPVKRETCRLCPQADSDEACLQHGDEHSEHHRAPDAHGRLSNYKIDPPFAKDLSQSKKNDSLRHPCHPADVVDRKHPKSGGREVKTSCRRKIVEPSKAMKPLTETLDLDDTIALKRKPGCAVCKKDHSVSAQKKGILKGKRGGGKTPDIRNSIMHLGLSNIISPARNNESSYNKTQEKINVDITYNSFVEKVSENHSPQPEVEYLQSLASVIALETSKRSNSLQSDQPLRLVEDCVAVNCESTPIIVVCDSVAFNQGQKHSSKELLEREIEPGTGAFVKGFTNKSTVPSIFLTRAESNDMSGVENPDSSAVASPMQIAVSSVDPALEDFLIDSKLKDSSADMPLKESNSASDASVKEAASPFVEIHSKRVENVTEIFTSTAEASKPLGGTAVDTHSEGTPLKQVNDTAVDGYSKEIEKNTSSNPTDRRVDKQTSSPKLDDPVSIESGPIRSLDSEYSPELSNGCVFTAMRRYMKSHQRPERTGNFGQTTHWNKCPGFRFAGVPVFQNDCLRMGKRFYRHCCKSDFIDKDSSAETVEELCNRVPQRCTTDSASSSQKHDPANSRNVECYSYVQTDEVQKLSSDVKHGCNASPETKSLWKSVLRRYKPKPTSSPAQDPSMSYEGDSRTLLIRKGNPKHMQDSVSSLKLVKGVCCSGSLKYRPKSPEQMYKEEPIDNPIQAIRTLPPDMATADTFRMRYPRSALAFPESPVCARKRTFGASSALAGEVQTRHDQYWPLDHTYPRRHFKLLEDICDRCRKVRQRVPSWVYDGNANDTDEAFVANDRDDLDECLTYFCPHQVGRKNHGV